MIFQGEKDRIQRGLKHCLQSYCIVFVTDGAGSREEGRGREHPDEQKGDFL